VRRQWPSSIVFVASMQDDQRKTVVVTVELIAFRY